MSGTCESCGDETDDLVVLTRAPDWAEDDHWCRSCAERDPSAA